ncbi:hypothetical protein TrST_g1783 [Triparma strigata]|uniref:Uncharacterized protein n=1 Tax=Triparma strigata TaxID=1606541 RepID=A0A9W7BSC7_9STRA|nr:hypothetical protein TrST_g1783 [Triparma strigata]
MSELAQEAAARRQSGRRASAQLDAEQQKRVEEVKNEEDAAALERTSNQRRASAMLDLEQASRIQKLKLEEEMDGLERSSNQRRASKAMDMEQQRRVSDMAKEESEAKAERKKSQELVGSLLDEEQKERIAEQEAEAKRVEEERKKNAAEAALMMDEEQTRRMEEKPRAKSLASEKGVLEELQDEVDENVDGIADVGEAKGLGQNPGEKATISDKASANVQELMKADAGDESLRKYKEQLLGKAAKGDLGDTSDTRKVVVIEFKVVFEDKGSPDQVFNLDTEEGVAKLTADGLQLKEGAGFRFELKFRVNHEILTGLKFINKTKKGIFSQSEDVVIGSFAPATEPYSFAFPRYGFNNAPAGMMFRGVYKATDKFTDSDGNEHLTYDYKVKIVR